ncbi:MAG: hypothetical protein JO170_29640 [Verrucomicrobia bacterium]|nr:hypothetical protein [Verrucomicrobiota bacterium]
MTSIRRHGLLSAERLVTRVARSNAEIDAILGSHREDSLILRDGVCIRDQRPMPPTLLKQVLCDGMTSSDWVIMSEYAQRNTREGNRWISKTGTEPA